MISGAFTGGVHPEERKVHTKGSAIRQAKLPLKVVIPMIQHTGAPCEPLVKAGDQVKKGQLIGRAEQFITSPVHASISGVVKEIGEAPHPTLGKAISISIESDGRDEWYSPVKPRNGLGDPAKDEIINIVEKSGIVGLGGAAFPAHVKLRPPKKIDTVVLNGAECEPYITCDDRIMTEMPEDIIKGLLLMMKAVDAGKAIIAIESNKPGAIGAMRAALKNNKASRPSGKEIILKVLPVKYPQGSEKQLIYAVSGKRVPPGGLPLDVGCVVYNVGTALAISEAVYEGRPLIERCITVSGDCVREPLNLRVRIGTGAKELLDECGGAVNKIAKVIIGGPMMGIAQAAMDVPVIKGTSGVLFLSENETRLFSEAACIKCGKCVNACPMNLAPLEYAKLVKKERWKDLDGYDIDDCMECGSCAYICPGRIPLVQYIKTGKRELFNIRNRLRR